jgi:predicted small lipoprotein YifL
MLLGLGGCGQTGVLYLPTEPAAANRATLPQSVWPVMPEKKQPAAGAQIPAQPTGNATPATPSPASSNAPYTP